MFIKYFVVSVLLALVLRNYRKTPHNLQYDNLLFRARQGFTKYLQTIQDRLALLVLSTLLYNTIVSILHILFTRLCNITPHCLTTSHF